MPTEKEALIKAIKQQQKVQEEAKKLGKRIQAEKEQAPSK